MLYTQIPREAGLLDQGPLKFEDLNLRLGEDPCNVTGRAFVMSQDGFMFYQRGGTMQWDRGELKLPVSQLLIKTGISDLQLSGTRIRLNQLEMQPRARRKTQNTTNSSSSHYSCSYRTCIL